MCIAKYGKLKVLDLDLDVQHRLASSLLLSDPASSKNKDARRINTGDDVHGDVYDDLHDVHASPKYKDALPIHAGYDVREGDNDDVNDVHASSHKEIHAGES